MPAAPGLLRRVLGLEAVSDVPDQNAHDGRVELRAGESFELGESLLPGERRSVRAGRDHGLVSIARADDPRGERDLLAGETVRVSGPVPVLVARAGDRRD